MTEQEKEKLLEKFKVNLKEDRYWRVENKTELVLFSLVIGYTEGLTIQDLCRVNNISPSTLYEWKQKFIENGSDALLNGGKSSEVAKLEKENKILKQRIGDLTLENELIKNL
jgi:transposase-like protein